MPHGRSAGAAGDARAINRRWRRLAGDAGAVVVKAANLPQIERYLASQSVRCSDRLRGCTASSSPPRPEPLCVPHSDGRMPLYRESARARHESTYQHMHSDQRPPSLLVVQSQALSQDAQHGERHAVGRPLAVAERRQLSQSVTPTQGLYVEVSSLGTAISCLPSCLSPDPFAAQSRLQPASVPFRTKPQITPQKLRPLTCLTSLESTTLPSGCQLKSMWSPGSMLSAIVHSIQTSCGRCVQAFVPYGNASVAGALPIPASLQPSSVATAPNVSYPDVAASDLFNLARGAKTYFGLRFTGE